MRHCPKCQQHLPEEQFYRDSIRYCKECFKSYTKTKFHSSYKIKKNERCKSRTRERRSFISKIKIRLGGCSICCEKEPVALDFHHLDSSTKRFGISSAVVRSEKSILEEINKCCLLCSNCHRKQQYGLIDEAALIPISITSLCSGNSEAE